MSVDAFTLVAQILNFVILVLLLNRFLYRPILSAVESREALIRGRLEAADAREREAVERLAAHDREAAALEEARAARLRETEEAAAELGRRLTQEVRDDARRMRDEWRSSVGREREEFLVELRRRMAEELRETVRRTLGDLADVDLQDRVIDVFLGRLATISELERELLLREVQRANGRVRVRTAFPLSGDRRRDLAERISRWTYAAAEPSFEVSAELAVGIELVAGDRKLGWSAASYLDRLAAATTELIEGTAG